MMPKIPIAVADDHKLFLGSFSEFLDNHSPCQVVIRASSGEELLEAVKHTPVDLLLTDINMPGKNGLTVIKEMKMHYPQTKIIAVSQYEEPRLMAETRALGADGYFIKSNDPDELLEIVALVLSGGKAFYEKPPLPVQVPSLQNHPILLSYQFTPREIEIFSLVGQNFSNKAIAAQLFISEFTVETHNKNICRKLQTSKRGEVIQFYQQFRNG